MLASASVWDFHRMQIPEEYGPVEESQPGMAESEAEWHGHLGIECCFHVNNERLQVLLSRPADSGCIHGHPLLFQLSHILRLHEREKKILFQKVTKEKGHRGKDIMGIVAQYTLT